MSRRLYVHVVTDRLGLIGKKKGNMFEKKRAMSVLDTNFFGY